MVLVRGRIAMLTLGHASVKRAMPGVTQGESKRSPTKNTEVGQEGAFPLDLQRRGRDGLDH
jgi:hypothetical protein